MSNLRRLIVAADPSSDTERALGRAAWLAARHGARVTVLHALDLQAGTEHERDPEPDAQGSEARSPGRTGRTGRRSRAHAPVEADVRVVSGRALGRIIAEAGPAEADLVVVAAPAPGAMHDPLIGGTIGRVLRAGDRPVLLVKRRPNAPYRRVLVPVDFSGLSGRVLEFARALAPGAALSVLHVCDVELDYALRRGGATDDQILTQRRQRFESAAADLDSFVRAHTRVSGGGARQGAVVRLVAEGRPATVIPEVARRRRADLVVIGTHGRSGLRHVLLGRVAEHVLRSVTCDVLALRPEGFRFESAWHPRAGDAGGRAPQGGPA